MSLDPQNPVFRSVDKVILLLALVVAALAVYNTMQKQSLVKQAVATMGSELNITAQHVEKLPVPPELTQKTESGFDGLRQRFERLDMPGHPFRQFVFYSPKEVILAKLSIQLIAGRATQAVTEFDPIKPSNLPGITMDMMKLTVTDKSVADVTIDKDKNMLLITPKAIGVCIVRLVGVEGSRIELPLEITPIEIMVPNNPELPENFTAVPNRGYNTISWKTNPKSIPAEIHTICRSSAKNEDPAVVQEIKVDGRETPSKDDLAAIMAKATAGGIDAERLCSPTIIQYSWDDLDVKPGVEYFYYVKTSCVIRDKDKKESLEDTKLSSPVSAKAASPFVISLVGGFGDTARVEVERWFGYVPRHKVFMLHCGEPIGDKEYASGLTLVAFEETVNEEVRSVSIAVNGRPVIESKPVLVTTQRMVAVDAQNNTLEMLKSRGNKFQYDRNITQFFKTCEKDPAPIQSPRFMAGKGMNAIKGSSVIAVVNDSASKLTMGMRSSKDKLILDVPAFGRRTISIEPGQFELGGMFEADNPDDSPIVSYEPAKHDLKDNQTYQITFELKKAAPVAGAK